jgi:predicted RecA/RadA family phage recombinase
MQNFQSRGITVSVPSPVANVASGQFVLVGASIFGAAIVGAVNVGDDLELVTEGVYQNAPKAAGAAWAIGDILYWDNTAGNFTKTATNNTRVGTAVSVQASGDTAGSVKLGVHTV